jgi:hypothetical protein
MDYNDASLSGFIEFLSFDKQKIKDEKQYICDKLNLYPQMFLTKKNGELTFQDIKKHINLGERIDIQLDGSILSYSLYQYVKYHDVLTPLSSLLFMSPNIANILEKNIKLLHGF